MDREILIREVNGGCILAIVVGSDANVCLDNRIGLIGKVGRSSNANDI